MRLLILLFIPLVLGEFSYHRIRRQINPEKDFWWLNLPVNGNPEDSPVASESGPGAEEAPPPEEGFTSGFNSQTGTKSESDFSVGSERNHAFDVKSAVQCHGPGTVCVPYYLCEHGNAITDGASVFDIRVGEKNISTHSNCQRYLDVCCRQPEIDTDGLTETVIHSPRCGRRNSKGVHAQVTAFNVTQTQFGEYPWMIAILRIEKIGGEDVNLYLCGGSLLQPNVILTAAHCVDRYKHNTLKVRAGEWDTQSDYELYPHQDQIVSQVIIHPEFNDKSLWNDYAVLILNSSFVLAPNVDTICLPNVNDNFDNNLCYATGWGKDKFGEEGVFQNVLKQVSLNIVHHGTCEALLQKTRLGEYFGLHDSFICAGGEAGVDTCKGDGGSPLVCARYSNEVQDMVYYQAGIVAWGIGCGENNVPGVYADVRKAQDWIYQSYIGHL